MDMALGPVVAESISARECDDDDVARPAFVGYIGGGAAYVFVGEPPSAYVRDSRMQVTGGRHDRDGGNQQSPTRRKFVDDAEKPDRDRHQRDDEEEVRSA